MNYFVNRERATFMAVTGFKENCFRIKGDVVAILR